MDIDSYRQRVIALEADLSNQTRRHVGSGREQLIDTAADAVDASVADESENEDFTDAHRR